MTPIPTECEPYDRQLCRYVEALARMQHERVTADIAQGFTPDRVKMFVDGNLDKRFEKLKGQLEFVAAAFDDFEKLLGEYIRALPLAAYDTGASDGNRFLEWVEQHCHLTPEQSDYVVCQHARYSVEDYARTYRTQHVRFQEQWRMADQLGQELESNSNLRIHLNPIRVWSRFETLELLDEEAYLPAPVLFYAVGTAIRTAVLESSGAARIEQLARLSPCSLGEWLGDETAADPALWHDDQPAVSREELIALCRELTDMGLIAFG